MYVQVSYLSLRGSTIPNLFEPHLYKGIKVCSVPIHLFQVVQPQQTSSNLFEPLQCRESKVCIGLSHEFGVVRLYRTFSNHSSKWFDYAEPFRTTYPQGDQGVYGTYTLVPGGPTAANLLEPSRTTSVQRKQSV